MGVESERSGDLGRGVPQSVEELVAGLADHLPELIVVLDEDGRILWYNLTAEGVLGWRREEWVGREITAILHPDDVVKAAELLVSARATGPGAKEPVPYRLASVDDWVPIEVVASVVRLANGRSVIVASARVAGRARREEFIVQEVGERVSFAFEQAVVAMAKVGLDGVILSANAALAERLGAEPAELHGLSVLGLVAPADRPAVTGALEQAAEGGVVAVDACLSGTEGHQRLHLSLVPDWLGSPMYLFLQITG